MYSYFTCHIRVVTLKVMGVADLNAVAHGLLVKLTSYLCLGKILCDPAQNSHVAQTPAIQESEERTKHLP